jgi:glycosyltransferase involved in cell wall biosynthesis
MQVRARQQGVWQKDVHRFIALTDFARAKFIEGGLPPDRIVVKPNALTASVLPIINQRIGVLFVGRLSLEKGVSTLVEAAKLVPNLSVTIVGDGPDRDSLEATASPNVKFLGAVSGKKVRELMAVAQALVMPSIWYEGFPVTLLEAFSSRLPIIASRIGSLESLISHKDTGLHFEAANTNQLSEHLKLLVEHPEIYTKMGENAYTEFKTHYTVKPNRELLENIYRDAIITAENRGF